MARNVSPCEQRRACARAEDAELGLLELRAGEGEGRDQQGHGEADPGDRPAGRDRRPPDRRAEPAAAEPGDEPGDADDADRLADHVAEEDPERDRGADRTLQERAVDRDPGVGQCEQRHDHVARPRMKELLEALIRRDRGPEAPPGRPLELRRRLLAELAKALDRLVEVRALGGIRVGEQAHGQPDDHRLDSGLEQRHPDRDSENEIQRACTQMQGPRDQDRREQPAGGEQGRDADRLGVDGGDDDQGEDVVDNGHGEDERPQAVGNAVPEDGQQTQGERGVRRHRDAPAPGRRLPDVEGEVDGDGHRHPTDRCHHRQGETAPRSRSSPRSNSRRASRPTTKKKKVIRPLLTQ